MGVLQLRCDSGCDSRSGSMSGNGGCGQFIYTFLSPYRLNSNGKVLTAVLAVGFICSRSFLCGPAYCPITQASSSLVCASSAHDRCLRHVHCLAQRHCKRNC